MLQRLIECSTFNWQKALVFHQMGCVKLERKEYKEAQYCFQAAVETGHVYSFAGIARTKHKLGQSFSAYEIIYDLIAENKPTGWMYQERSLYSLGKSKIFDLNNASKLDPTLRFPYMYRAVSMVETNQINEAIAEINKTHIDFLNHLYVQKISHIYRFKVSRGEKEQRYAPQIEQIEEEIKHEELTLSNRRRIC